MDTGCDINKEADSKPVKEREEMKGKKKYGVTIAAGSGVLIAFVLVMAATASLVSGCGPTSSVKAGMSEKVITPPVGSPMAGYRRQGVSTGVHDDLFARSLVIEDGSGTTVAFITLGIINLSENYMDSIRKAVSEQTGIPVKNIVVSCTHTHSGPALGGCSDEYKKLLVDNSVACAVEAWNNRKPSFVGTGSTVCLDLGMNDRRMEYGGLHPDPEVGIIKVQDLKGKLTGVAFVYGCHPSTLDLHNLEFTEDWPYYAIKGIKEQIGEDVWVAYYQSAQGDVKVGYTAELSAVGADMGIRNWWFAEHKGSQMTWPVLEALDEIETSGALTVDATSAYYDFPLRDSYPVTAAEAERLDREAKAKLAEMEKKADSIGKRVLDRYRVDVFLSGLTLGCARWVESHPNPKPIPMLLQAVRIGDTVIATFPVEVFAEIGLAVKERSPVEKTFIIGLASGHGGYMPTADEYLEGGYSAVMTRYSPKCEQVLIESSLELIGKVSDQ
ncbi:MAG: neutral/alkaline non-lysosomal ceramidase N-terminal domain-containing protein [Candidatus Latescibacteria bacterium]|nr:neutral/alkaline non-lysosomal ceramidase N-terminal domain-containing protein [Candidatus Latescibacterota bacterium]